MKQKVDQMQGDRYKPTQIFSLRKIASCVGFVGSFTGWLLIHNSSLKAQITSDGTLGTTVNTKGQLTEITGGTKAETNLFHSFENFSVATDNIAFFNNAANIRNIISRVTGDNISSINGLIKANGNANLILINPNGINLGENASLDIGGSFLGTTADSLQFEDGTVFSATNSQSSALLTVSVPVGLQLGQNPASISVSGKGHNVSLEAPIFSPFTIGEVSGLKVKTGQTLALVGGNLNIDGGTLTAKSGRIELGSAAGGIVNLDSIAQGWRLSYDNVSIFQDISLSQTALADTSGINSGSIQVQGREVSLADGSIILIQNQGDLASGSLIVNASESLEISGATADGGLSSGLFTDVIGSGSGGKLAIATQRLKIRDGGGIIASTFTDAEAGLVTINASESLQIIGFSAVNPSRFSIISGQTFGSGKAGDIRISTKELTALNGGNIASVTAGATSTGSGGQVNINASEFVQLIGVTPEVLTPSQITAGTGGAGNAGDVTINTQRLEVSNGGRVDASTTATGNAGSVIINASDSVEVSGTVPNSLNPSLIISSANILDPSLQQLFRLPPVPSGNSGDITINTSQLSITDGALVTARNDGFGNAGSVRINANSIFLNNDSGITSEIGIMSNIFSANESIPPEEFSFSNNSSSSSSQNSENVQGGGIDISTQTLLVEGGATISTNTFTDLGGGNITIDASSSIKVQGFSAVNPSRLSFISTSSFGAGNSGDLNLSTGKLTILDGGRVGAGTFGVGLGGDINVEATESLEVIGAEPSQSVASLLGVSSLGVGDAGNLTIDTTKLVLRDGGRIDSSTAATGSAGNVNIQASESIEISGTVSGNSAPSLISSGANIEDELAQQILGLPPVPSGNAGNVTINTESLKITELAEVSVVNEGLGDAGTLNINADSIFLDLQGTISAATKSGEGGNILFNADNIIWRGGSITNATAAGNGNGGNIIINANNLAVLENSQLTADANEGMGGNIAIATQGLFVCGDCQISASSRLGLDGIVKIQALEPNTQLETVNLPQQPTESTEEVAIACATDGQTNTSKLTITGRGGLPTHPKEPLSSESIIGFDSPVTQVKRPLNSPTTINTTLPLPARSWYVNSQGTVVLAAQSSGTETNDVGINSPDCHLKQDK